MERLPGRGAESAVLAAAARDAGGGVGRLVLLTGEAGIGKSRLAQALAADMVTAGATVARGWCVDDPAAPPLWPWHRVAQDIDGLAEALGTLTGEDAADAARWWLTEAVARVLQERSTDCLCIVLEDLHWADPVSLDLLRRLLPEVSRSRVLLVATARHDGLERSAYGQTLPGLLRASSTVHVPISGLSAEAVADWLDQDDRTAGWARHAADLVQRTGGNPFYIQTLVAEVPVPGTDVATVLAQRPTWRTVLVAPYRSLPHPESRTVAMAAVMGERLAPGLLAQALGLPVREVSEHLSGAVTAGILHFGPAGLAFNHALVRDAIVSDLSPAQRAEAHAGAAAALEAAADPLLSGPAALHWSRVEGPVAAARCRDLATVAAAASALAPGLAVDLARFALRSAQSLGAPEAELAERLLLVTRFEWAAGMLAKALETCATGLDAADAAGRPDLMAEFALVPQGVGSYDVAVVAGVMCRRALRALPTGQDGRRARLLALCAVAGAEAAQPPQDEPPTPEDGADRISAETPVELSARALAAARRSGDQQAELETIAARHFVLSYPQAIEERTGLAHRALEMAPTATTTMGALWGLLWRADLAFQRGEILEVEQAIADVERVAARRSSPVARWHALRLRSALCILKGHFDAARSTALDARALADRVGDLSMIGMHHAFHVNLALLRGDADEILPDSLELIEHAPAMPLVRVSVPLIWFLRGDLKRARAEFASLRDVPSRTPLGPRWLGTVGQIGNVAALLDDREVARTCYRLLLPTAPWCGADGGGSPFAIGSNEFPLGQLAQAAGERRLAAEHFVRGVAVDDRIGARPFAALGRLGLAEVLFDDDRGHALAVARDAADELERLGLPGALARARRLLGRFPPDPSRPPDRPGGLTEREHEVALLIGQAMTNVQIAGQLFLSVRTVESHVRNILTKLDLASRTQIVVWLHEHHA